jgi:hypothetical protein
MRNGEIASLTGGAAGARRVQVRRLGAMARAYATILRSNPCNIAVFSPRCAPAQPIFPRNRGDSVPRFFFWCAQHGRDMEVKVLWRTWPLELQANREAQAVRPKLKEAKSGSCESTNRTWVEGAGSQGEPAKDGEALVAKGERRKPSDRAAKVTTLTWGDLASRPKGRRCEAEIAPALSPSLLPACPPRDSNSGRSADDAFRRWISSLQYPV